MDQSSSHYLSEFVVNRHLQTNDLELKTRLEITEDLTIRNTSYNVETDVDYAHEVGNDLSGFL